MDKFYLAVNDYRTSTSDGFGNTWRMRWVATKQDQERILRQGLPVKDQEFVDSDGKRSPCLSTKGIRILTSSERRSVKRDPELASVIEA